MNDASICPSANVPIRYVGLTKDDIDYELELALTEDIQAGVLHVVESEAGAVKSLWRRAANEIVIGWASTEEIVENYFEHSDACYEEALDMTHPSMREPD